MILLFLNEILLISILEPMGMAFTKISNYGCSHSYNGQYLTIEEADFACAADQNCHFIQSLGCMYPNDFGLFELCGYDATLVFSNSNCVYQKQDTNRPGSIFASLKI